MPIDTSIPLQIGQGIQTQALNPMTLYQMMQERQTGALRNQLVQQEMLKNAMVMQNTEEDRRIAAAARAQAAQKAAEDRRRLGEYRGIVGNFGVTPAVVGQRGAGYSGTGLSTDPYESVRNQLVRGGFVPQAEEIAKLQKEQLAGEESKAKIPGLKAVSDKQITEAADAQLKQFQTGIERALTPEAVDMLIKANPAAIAVAGSTPEKSINMFRQRVAEVGFDRARMEVSQGVMAVQKHLSDIATAETARNKPIEMDLGGKKILVDPVTLQPKAEFAKTLTPDEATKSGKTKDAKSSLDDTLARLDEEYTALSGLGAQPSEKENVVTNLGRRFTSSYIGQSLGVNPQAQTHIQNIEGLRNDVLLAIKNATGMSAKEMDSNVELQRQLAGATAPGQNIESVRRRLTDISRKYGLGKDFTKTEEKSANAASATENGGRKIAKFSDIEHTAKVNNLSIEEVKKRVRAMGMTIEGE